MSGKIKQSSKRRAVIIDGCRTPFIRAFGPFTKLSTYDLGSAAVKALLERTHLPWNEIDGIYWGGVVMPGTSVNIGREIVLDLGLPPTIEAVTVTRACTSSLNAITMACMAIENGDADVIIAGGSDSTSNAQVKMPQSFVHKVAPVALSGKATAKDYFRMVMSLNRKDVLPERPAITERTTGELMGESAEKMAEMNQISREDQDKFAVQSHRRAAKAIETGRFGIEVIPVTTPDGSKVHTDNIVRGDTSVEKMAKLRPAFKKSGTLTAANSSALTDGGAAVLVMTEEKAKALGYKPKAAFLSWHYGAVDPTDQLLIGPAVSMPKAVQRAGMNLKDIDLIDIHEAFAAQVLSVLKMLGSKKWGQERLGLDGAFGEIAPESINIHGGSVALGHPFAATGARMVITMANELAVTDKQTALLGLCAQGGLSAGAVMVKV